MFIGAINSQVRAFLAQMSPALAGRACVVGCSGNFTSEAILTKYAKPSAIFSNDVSLYSSLAGAFLTGKPFRLALRPEFESETWLGKYLTDSKSALAALMVLMDMLPFERQDTIFKRRMWAGYKLSFDQLHSATLTRLDKVSIQVADYFAGDVFEHFKANDQPGAVFMCYAPTYKGGYERIYKRLAQLFDWDEPSYPMLDEAARDNLVDWVSKRDYVWYDDRIIPQLTLKMVQQSGRQKTVYIYSNLAARPIYVTDHTAAGLPKMPLANQDTIFEPGASIKLLPMKTSDLARFKNAYLGKGILFGAGTWAFSVWINGQVVGFLEFSKGKYQVDELYLQADFPVSGTRYPRLSKLLPMLAMCGDTRRVMERINMLRLGSIFTTAFTDKPVSMKYRGVFELVKRGQDKTGKAFLNYRADFNALTWTEVYSEWLQRHGSTKS